MNNINVEGALLINGTQGRHYFKNVIFDSTVTINNATANFITFEQCSFAGGISIASNVTATIYFDRCALGNQFITSSRAGAGSPLLTILTECSGVNALQANLTSNVALVGRTGFNSGLVVQYQNSDSYVYDLNNGLSTSFSGSYSELRNKPTIPTSSDDLTEGSTNLFYTNSRFDTRLATKTTDNLTEGSTNLYFTNTRFDNRLSTKTTDNLSEGSSNLYYTSTRVNSAFDTRLATKTTDDLTEGSTNLYFTTARARSSFSAGSNITIVDGQISASTGGGSRPTISDKTSNFTISTPSASTLQEIYTVSGSSAVTMTLPDATACTGMRYDIKRLGTATTTIACNGSQTIDALSTIQLLAQYASVTVISTGTNWIII
jgi:hypothetical protein